jgi:hypothetical protein
MRLKYLFNNVTTPSAAYQFSMCPFSPGIMSQMKSKITMAIRKSLRLPIDFPSGIIYASNGLQITHIKQIFIFKSLGDLRIASRPALPHYQNAINYSKQMSDEINSNHNILKKLIWIDGKNTSDPFSHTLSLMENYKIANGQSKNQNKFISDIHNC